MKILVPVDASEFAFKALEKAIQMAKEQGAQLTIMCVAAQFEEVAEEVPISYSDKLKEQARRTVNRGKQLVEEAGLTCQTVVEVGASPADNIVRYAEEFKTDLIVLGHRGISGLARFLVGSVASRVVAHAPCSVQVVR
jgi:nucleotide-binding universal stress UspA family protein